jgi:RimJ/RimL family protein N-acetyltransferase
MPLVERRFEPPPREELFVAEGVRVRSFEREDSAAIARHLADPLMWQHFSVDFDGGELTARDGEVYLIRLHRRPRSLNYGGELVQTGQIIGCLNAQLGEGVHGRCAEFGGWMARPYWRSGFARATTEQFIQWLFERHGVLRVYAAPFETNRASIGTLQACGFEYEGRLRCGVFKGGRTQDQLMFARINPAAATLPSAASYREQRRAERERCRQMSMQPQKPQQPAPAASLPALP